MPFTKNWALLFLARLKNENAIVHDIEDDEIETDGIIYGFKIAIGTGSGSFDRDHNELLDKDLQEDANLGAIDDSNPNEVFFNYDATFNFAGVKTYREYGVYVMVKDLAESDKQILIRRDLLATPFTTNPSEDFKILYKASASTAV
jgi:hypothetical protein